MAADRFRLADPDEPFRERYLQQFESGHDVHSVAQALASNADWMVGNTVLALIPVWLAHRLFVRCVEATPLRWLALAAFVAFVPNALYVFTDLIHLASEGEQLSWSAGVWLVLVPAYAAFVAVGITAYTSCHVMLYRWLRERHSRLASGSVLLTLHLASACGVYLGRVVRLNSWQFVTSPGSVADGVHIMLTRLEALAYAATIVDVGGLLMAITLPLARRLLRAHAPAAEHA